MPQTSLPADLGPLADRVFAAVLFDMDGTLIDSTPSVNRSWSRWAQEFGVGLTSLAGMHGIPAGQVMGRLVGAERLQEAVARIEEIELADVEGILVLPGAAEALAATGGHGAIVTSCTSALAKARIAATGLQAPDVIVTADQVAVGKPNPAPFLLAAEKLGVDPADCLVVEDAPAGLAAALAAGSFRLALSTTHTPDELEADAIVANLAAVRFVVEADGVRLALA
ncbi:MAG TPA: HAD-IA family hydrolase [Kineosporiaceae bacterium]|nr:HAD-IA family hydrolase [Kineosporiaceae bacterium]